MPSAFKKFLAPLHEKLGRKDILIWVIFLAVCFTSTYIVTNFISAFAEDQDSLSATFTSVGKYREGSPDTASLSSPPEELEGW